MEAGIPVICLERDILQPNYTTYIHSDNRGHRRAWPASSSSTTCRRSTASPRETSWPMRGLLGRGRRDQPRRRREGDLREVSRRFKIVADPVADWIQAKAKDRMTEVLRAQPKIDVVYGHNDPMAVGAYLAAKELGRDKEMIFVGVDGLGGAAGGIQEGDGRRPGGHVRLSAVRRQGRRDRHAACCASLASSRRRTTSSNRSWSPRITRRRCTSGSRYHERESVSHSIDIPATANKAEFYREVALQLSALLTGEQDPIANAANTAALIYHTLPEVNWAGFYFLKEGELVLGPFQGKPACVRIALGRGVCGTAAEARKSVVVPDVNAFPGHIACDTASRSELVVPLVRRNVLVGVLDLDSPLPGRFDEDDRRGCESLAAIYLAASKEG